MKQEAILEYYMVNGRLYPTADVRFFDEIDPKSIYEVIRIIDGVPLYLEAHLERMRKSAHILGFQIHKSDQEIVSELVQLVEANGCPNLNVKLLCSHLQSSSQTFLLCFIESHYPEREVYGRGIDTILFHSERENPNAKVVNVGLRERIQEEIKKKGAFEAILVNDEGYITEGSRSNIFFVRGDMVYTAPAGEVLLGVTRTRIMEVCKALGIGVIEQPIPVKDLAGMEGAFMTGTSVNVLPIASIDQQKFDSVNHPIIEKIARGYENDMEAYRASSKVRAKC
ncbi:aminotransferase class IV [Thermotalea metallivorans]|uniref:Branched-chain-amino-acid aminotransferase n=1 Tax=Thermotalea metallivorans TaxID=520762 RepID=A0A140L3Z8_9FIRM|nr:aminotransferase class IV [Thermotalea metallivorans]KXG75273.1 Branched-chain-amino-acid aminotransferase [Thermotalea metallivorans]